MAKRGERRPWRLTTTWAHADIKPFTETFRTADEALSERVRRMIVDNVRGNSDSLFEITNRDNPGYQAPPAPRCLMCFRWATDYGPGNTIHRNLCAEHAEDVWADYNPL